MAALVVSLDARQIDEKKQQRIKVAVQTSEGKILSKVVPVDSDKVDVRFDVDQKSALQVAVGPADASDDDLLKLETIGARVTPQQWREPQLVVPLILTPYYWKFWLGWCRKITITGRVVCPNGSPAPGAQVTAYDVDFFWWWLSSQKVGSTAVTDANGVFTISFKWCCGWLPIWWWRLRYWALEPLLANRILPVLRLDDRLPRPPRPDPVPDIAVFTDLLGSSGLIRRSGTPFDPTLIPSLRDGLVAKLPRVPELERLRIWPWYPWTPWLDCTPDIIFRVTQNCGDGEKVIVKETVFDTRWDIPNSLNVTLVANDQACCGVPPPPSGECIVLTKGCSTLITDIEQNTASPLVGLVNANDPVNDSDMPFAGAVTLRGQFGDAANVDYYEIEYTTTPAAPASWAPIPPASAGGFTRVYLDISPGPTVIPQTFGADFSVIDGKNVVESLEHFETNNPPPAGVLRVPVGGQDVLVNLLTGGNFGDGVYYFRVKGYTLSGVQLLNPRVLLICNTTTENSIALRLDNRFVDTAAPFTPPFTSPTQPCGDGTVHACTTEPDTRIIAIRYNNVEIPPCGVVTTSAGGPLEIDFFAYDPDGFLSSFSLVANYDENLQINLLGLPGASITSVALAGPPPAADEVGPTYIKAIGQGATRPTWTGGEMRLTIPNVSTAFPKTCAYTLQLDAYKRNIADCNYSKPYRNRSHYSLTVIV
jgi:hypothetical protein